MKEDIGVERALYGEAFGGLHGGYFSSPEVARPLIEAARSAWTETHLDMVVDLGGGTGFLLSQFRSGGFAPETGLVNLDGSPEQLDVARSNGIPTVCGSVEDFHRADVVPAGKRALFLMRSVLHYFGEAGLAPVLEHLRTQAKEGEVWIHQTACFEHAQDAACLSDVYQRIHTAKWYPTIDDLQHRLAVAGWMVVECRPAPTLCLESADLGARYGVDKNELRRIQKEMLAEYGEQSEVFRITPAGFQADLRYHIFVCRAVS